jgi:hypothetical protein
MASLFIIIPEEIHDRLRFVSIKKKVDMRVIEREIIINSINKMYDEIDKTIEPPKDDFDFEQLGGNPTKLNKTELEKDPLTENASNLNS